MDWPFTFPVGHIPEESYYTKGSGDGKERKGRRWKASDAVGTGVYAEHTRPDVWHCEVVHGGRQSLATPPCPVFPRLLFLFLSLRQERPVAAS